MNKVYYLVRMVDNCVDYAKNLPISLKSHARTKESACAWNLIIKEVKSLLGVDLKPGFLSSGKPVADGVYISLAHSNGVVAVCFSKGVSVGVDIEVERKEIPPKTLEFLNAKKEDFFTTWTKREAVIKAKDYSALKKGVEDEFVGITKTLNFEGKTYYLSVFGENAKFIEI
jgi:hypothetical protein